MVATETSYQSVPYHRSIDGLPYAFAVVGVIVLVVGGVRLFLKSKSIDGGDSVTPSVLTRINAEYNDTRH